MTPRGTRDTGRRRVLPDRPCPPRRPLGTERIAVVPDDRLRPKRVGKPRNRSEVKEPGFADRPENIPDLPIFRLHFRQNVFILDENVPLTHLPIMARTPQDITDAELAVLQVLWDEGRRTIRELTDTLYPSGTGVHYATVQKLL